jgi:tetratricopeptide (TPR) repeat protein
LRDLDRLSEAAHYAELSYAKAQQMANRTAIDQSLFVRASIYRQQGDLHRTAGLLAELEPRIARLPAGHILGGVLASEQAQLAQVRGDFTAASAGADRAVAIAEASTERAMYLPRFLARRSELAFQMGRLDQAAADAEAAVRLEEAISQAASSNNRGLSYMALGRALRGQGRLDQARAAFTSAVEQLKPSLGDDHPATRSALELAATMSSAGNR